MFFTCFFRRIKPEEISTRQLIALAYLSQIVFLILNAVFSLLFLSNFLSTAAWRQQLRAELSSRLFVWSIDWFLLGIVSAVILLIVVEFVSYFIIHLFGEIPGFYDYFIIARWPDRWRMVPAGILAGINEEFFFRGLLFSLLMVKWPEGPFGSNQFLWIMLISIGFGVLHAYQGVIAIFATSLVGILMFVFLLSTKSLIGPIVCHATYDVLAFLLNADLPSTRLALRRK
jgi:hypothetical protein